MASILFGNAIFCFSAASGPSAIASSNASAKGTSKPSSRARSAARPAAAGLPFVAAQYPASTMTSMARRFGSSALRAPASLTAAHPCSVCPFPISARARSATRTASAPPTAPVAFASASACSCSNPDRRYASARNAWNFATAPPGGDASACSSRRHRLFTAGDRGGISRRASCASTAAISSPFHRSIGRPVPSAASTGVSSPRSTAVACWVSGGGGREDGEANIAGGGDDVPGGVLR